ncbi:hypothetical protein K2173_004673 [Erythroxylum novogranatense]|uniref:Senescence regulator n=1 Tax=Erythroxylum novogranatense TaxID=1862640 RepID=A0AAV8T640_9ROSI|nr:hypothetical protein K2173_004673 [Erythroxylum novogranatense]
MADWHSHVVNEARFDSGGSRRSMRNEEFEEDDVWSVVSSAIKEREDSSPKIRKSNDYSSSGSSSAAWRLPSAPRMIRRYNTTNTNTTAGSHEAKVVQRSSAPMNIPDWSKIYGKNARIDSWANDGTVYSVGDDHHHVNGCQDDDVRGNNEFEEEDDDDGMVPPHEWIARKLARSQISSFSVCEGFGRTLKGRELSKVRNAILTKTGFLE